MLDRRRKPADPGTMNENELHVFFAVFGFGEDPSVVTKIMGVEPDEAWAKGEHYSKKSPNAVRTHSRWMLKSGLAKRESFEAHIEALTEKLEPLRQNIEQVAKCYEVGIGVALYSYTANSGIFLSAEAMRRISSLGIPMDFDIYCLGGGGE